MKRGGAIYIVTNFINTTLYIGVTENLKRRISELKNNSDPCSFTSKYKLYKLVYFEGFRRIDEAIAKEMQLKAGSRKQKEDLIKVINPEWKDLYDEIIEW